MFSSADIEEMGRGGTTAILIVVLAIASVAFAAGWFSYRAAEPRPVVVSEEPAFKYGDFVVVTSGFFEGAKGYVADQRLTLGVANEPPVMKFEVEFHKLPEGAPDLSQPPEVEFFKAEELRLVPVYGPLKGDKP